METPCTDLRQCDENGYLTCLGTLQELKTKENNMYQDIYARKASATTAATNVQVNMPAPPRPQEDKAREHLLDRAHSAQYQKRENARKAFGLEDDAAPKSLKDFLARIKDGKYVVDTDEKGMERERWDTRDVLEDIRWRDPSQKEDEAGFEAARKLIQQAYNDVSDEIIVKTPEAGLEALRAFQAKTFN
jgi:hypothetical protein